MGTCPQCQKPTNQISIVVGEYVKKNTVCKVPVGRPGCAECIQKQGLPPRVRLVE